MAFVNEGFTAFINLGAKNDRTRGVKAKLVAATYADAADAVTDEIIPKLVGVAGVGGVSAGAVKSYTISAKAVEDAYNRPTSADAESRDTAAVVVTIADNPTKTATLFIPMPKLDIFLAPAGVNMDVIDPADAALLLYVGLFATGGVATISDGELAETILNGRRTS